jgi:membrane protease YdiL (CAAX protease family)
MRRGDNMRAKQKVSFHHFSLSHPLQIGMMFFVIILVLRIIEMFYFRLDELWGEVFLSKLLGFLMIIGYLWLTKRKIGDIGLHSDHFLESISIVIVFMTISLVLSYFTEWIYLARKGLQPSLIIAPMSNSLDSEFAIQGGFLFGLWLIFGNFMNSFLEESLFRGVMMTHFRVRLSFWKANFLQAFLFGLWHIVWPIKSYILGQMSASEAIVFAIGYIFLSAIIGLVWGYLFLKTNNLWAPWFAHTMNNSTMNLLHTVTVEGFDSGFMIRMTVFPFITLLTLSLIKWMAEHYQMPNLKKWDEFE